MNEKDEKSKARFEARKQKHRKEDEQILINAWRNAGRPQSWLSGGHRDFTRGQQ